MAIETRCQTPDSEFSIVIHGKTVSCTITLPFVLRLTNDDAALLECNIHNAMEMVLSRYFSPERVVPGALHVNGTA